MMLSPFVVELLACGFVAFLSWVFCSVGGCYLKMCGSGRVLFGSFRDVYCE